MLLRLFNIQQLALSHRNSQPLQSVTVTPIPIQRGQGFSTDAWDRGPTVIEQASQRTAREDKKAGSQQQKAPHPDLSLFLDRYTPSTGRVDHQRSPYLSRQSGPFPSVFQSLGFLKYRCLSHAGLWSLLSSALCYKCTFLGRRTRCSGQEDGI